MSEALHNQPLESITPNRGKEFPKHRQVTERPHFEFLFGIVDKSVGKKWAKAL